PLSSQVVKSGDVFAGENWMTPAPVIWLMTVLETPDEAAPITALTPWPRRAVVDWVAMSVLVSPESRCTTETGAPKTPPASLTSLMPRLTPAISGGPRNASDPVVGRSDPSFRGVAVVVVEGGTGPVLVAAWLLPAPAPAPGAGQEMPGGGGGGAGPVLVAAWLLPAPAPALGAGQEMPAAAAELDPVWLGVEDPPQAVARRATPMPSAVSLAARGAAWERSNIRCLLD